MTIQRTLSIIKPDATSRNIIGKIIDRFESNDLKVVAGKLIHMNQAKAAGFYAEHDGKPLTVEDIKFTFDAIMDKDNKYKTARFKPYYENIESVEILSKTQVKFNIKTVYFWSKPLF